MRVEIVDCSDCNIDVGNGIADAAIRLVTEGLDEVEASYLGIMPEDLDDVLRTVIRSLKDDHAIGRTRVPDSGELADEGAPPLAMRSFLSHVNCDDLKIVVFDGGDEDAEDNGYCAFMIDAVFDTAARLKAAGLNDAILDLPRAPVPGTSLRH